MCVAIATPDRKHRPSLATLRACERANPHGNGVAWVQHNKVQWLKGISAETISELLDILEGPVVIHFRWATVGGKRTSLCHPFPISPTAPLKTYGQAGAVLFHNGHWHGWEDFSKAHQIKLEGAVSDTRMIAAGVHQLGRKLLRDIGHNRFAILTRKGFELFGDWNKVDGCHFSNLSWQPVKTKLPPAPAPAKPAKQFELLPRSRSLVNEAMACFGD